MAKQTIEIPTNLFDTFTLSDLTLKFHDNYVEAGLTPTFLPLPGFVPTDHFKGIEADLEIEYDEAYDD